MEYICSLHGYLIRLKEFHWSTSKNSEHTLCDEISGSVSGLEDEFAETAMGLFNVKIQVNELKPLLPRSEELKSMLSELESETIAMKKKLDKDKEAGLCNILDEIIAKAQKYSYRSTQE